MSTRTQRGRQSAGNLRDDYLELVREFPLRPIKTAREYATAAAILDRLAVRPEGTLSAGERDYFEMLTLAVEAHDDAHFKLKTARMDPVQALKYLMEQSGMTQAELARLLGNKALASMILHGQRQLSKTHIRILSDHFKVEPGLFLMAE